jgi:hypothetical protein
MRCGELCSIVSTVSRRVGMCGGELDRPPPHVWTRDETPSMVVCGTEISWPYESSPCIIPRKASVGA